MEIWANTFFKICFVQDLVLRFPLYFVPFSPKFLITQEQELLTKLDFKEISLGSLSYSIWETFKTKQRTAHYLYIC